MNTVIAILVGLVFNGLLAAIVCAGAVRIRRRAVRVALGALAGLLAWPVFLYMAMSVALALPVQWNQDGSGFLPGYNMSVLAVFLPAAVFLWNGRVPSASPSQGASCPGGETPAA